MFEKSSETVRMGWSTLLVISACVVDSVTIAYDGSVMGSVNVMPSYNRYFDITTTTKAVNSSATYLGAILMAPFAGIIVDKLGRKQGLFISAVLNVIGAAVTAAAQNTAMFIAGRMIIGIGVGLAQTAAGTYVAETTAPKIRAFALGLYYSCWAIGGFLAAGVSYGCMQLEPSDWAWRLPSLLQGFAPCLLIVLIPFLPESPRWLINQDRLDDGLKVLAQINGSNTDDLAVQVQYREIVDTLNYEKTEGKGIPFRDIVRTAPNRKRLVLALSLAPLTMLTGSNVVTYYYGDMLSQAGISDAQTQMQINLGLSAWQFIIAITGSVLAERLGRRLLCLTSLGLCTMMFYIVGALTAVYGSGANSSGVYGTVAAVFLYMAFYSFGLTPLTQMYPPEVLSYNLRGTGMAMNTLLFKVCGIFVTMVFPFMFASVGWRTYLINASWNVIFWVWVFFFWVETKGMTLEQIDTLFDGVKHSDAPDLANLKEARDEKVREEKAEQV